MSTGAASLEEHLLSLKRVLIAGANGQVGWELQRTAPKEVEVIALDSMTLDIRDQTQVKKLFDELSPDVVINAAAYTAVDKAEQEPELAYAVNATGAGNLAKASYDQGAHFIQLSTDFVFDGSQSRPYSPDDLPNPLGVYGESKLEGERLVAEYTNGQATVIRTAWVYSTHGANFVKTMLRLMHERDEVSVVVDQIGTPTWANGLAEATWKFIELPELKGVYHWTDAGVASWYDFASIIYECAKEGGLVEKEIKILPIRSADFAALAKRPSFSVLDCTKTWNDLGLTASHWVVSLEQVFSNMEITHQHEPIFS